MTLFTNPDISYHEGFQGITAFVYAVKHNSYAQAARVLGLSPSAIAKSISKLEDELGTRLFHRTTRSISLTENGFLFYERCCLILDELYSAKEIISSNMCTPGEPCTSQHLIYLGINY